MEVRRKRVALFFAELSALAFIVAGCSPPIVRISAMDGRVKEVESWLILWEGQPVSSKPNLDSRLSGADHSKKSSEKFAAEYLGEIGAHLSSDHGLNTAPNFAYVGTFSITIYGEEVSSPLRDTISEQSFKRHLSSEADVAGSSNGSGYAAAFAAGASLLSSGSRVRSVTVEVIGPDRKPLGTIYVSGKNVKPKHIADAIARALRGETQRGWPEG